MTSVIVSYRGGTQCAVSAPNRRHHRHVHLTKAEALRRTIAKSLGPRRGTTPSKTSDGREGHYAEPLKAHAWY